jgi:hypothetical protein
MAAFAVVNPIIDFGLGNATEINGATVRVSGDHISTPGDTLEIYGLVVQFNDPFGDLDPNDPTQEYTFVICGVSLGTTSISTTRNTSYTDATVRVYCDPAMNANPADKTSYTDGTLILEGSFNAGGPSEPALSTMTRTTSPAGSISHRGFLPTGGTLAGRLNGCTGVLVTGAFSMSAPTPPAGYFATGDTKLDVECPVPAEPSTWGKVKRGRLD